MRPFVAALLAALTAVTHPAGAKRTDGHGVQQVWVPPGSFRMGTDDAAMQAIRSLSPPGWVLKELASEQPAHDVRITSGYWIDRTEVTNAAFAAFADAGGYHDRALWSEAGWTWLQGRGAASLPVAPTGGPDHPRVRVTWFEAEAYARWRGGRLPTEAEWEFAARGPKSPAYPWGDTFDAARAVVAGATSSSPVGTHPRGASWIGAQDMAGNAMEWVHDWLDTAYYRSSPAVDPAGPDSGRVKVEKGGWWGSNPFVARAAYRHYEDPPDYGDQHIGFRVVTDERAPGERASAIAAEVERIASGTPLWPGFTPLSIPLAIDDGDRTYLFRHPSPPDGFAPAEGLAGASVMPGRLPEITANSSAAIGGVMTATVIADGTTAGETAVELAALTLHEEFHVFERTHHPSWEGNEADVFLYPVDRADLLAWRRLESRALAGALTAPDKESAACLAGRAMSWRAKRFAAMDAPFPAYERATELNEGLANYIQVRAAGKTTATFPDKEFGPADVRSRAYVAGAAMALLLDRLSPDWKTALEADDRLFLDDLLRAAADSAAAGARVAACDESPADIGAAESAARDDVAALAKARQDRRSAFDSLPGWRVVVTAAEGQPLQSGGFDPLNVARVEGGVLHTRYVVLKNEAGSLTLLKEGTGSAAALTEAAGAHPLFSGVARVTVAGLSRPKVTSRGTSVQVLAPGLQADFQGASVTTEGQTVSIRLGTAARGSAEGPPEPLRNFALETLADGVVAVIRQDPPGLMVDANDVFIINDDDVVVVDTNGNPAITREVLAALRRLTPKPVRYVVNTHYHDDHIRGNAVYRDAFPGVAFVAHPFARDYLPAQGAENRKSFLAGAPGFLEQLKGMLAKNQSLFGDELNAEERASMDSDVRLASAVLENGAAADTVLPTVTVADRLVLHRGRRTIEILALGSGHTAADLVVHLPAEGIVITGDLVAWPVPLVGSPQSHVADWAATLGRVRDLHARIIVPGHGPVLHDDSYLASIQSMFAAIASGARAAAARGDTLEQARKSIDLKPFKDALAGDSKVRRLLFSTYVAGPAVEAAYREAAPRTAS